MSEAAGPPIPPPPGPPPPPPAVARGRLPERVTGLSCASCGAPVEVEAGLRVVACTYCGTPLLVTGEPGVRRFAVAPEIDADAGRGTARRWLSSGWNKDRRLARDAQVGEAFLCFLPFFRVEADALGYALGTEERQRGSGKSRRRVEVDVERPVEKHLDRTFPALQVAEWGVQQVDLRGDRLVPFDGDGLARRGLVFSPTGSEAEIRTSALAEFRRSVDPRRGMKRVRFFWLETLRECLTVVYYPLWVVRYRFANRAYQVLVDAQDGRLAHGKAPGSDVYRALALVATEAAAAYGATTALQAGMIDDLGGVVALCLFVLFLVSFGWKRFRWGAVVEEGTGVRERRSVTAETLKSLLRGKVPEELWR